MTERFDGHDATYTELMEKVDALIANIPGQSWSDKDDAQREVRSVLNELEDVVGQMELEVRGMEPSLREPMRKRCATYKENIRSARVALKRAMVQSGEMDRVDLFDTEGGRDRAKVASSTARLKDSSARIKEARRVADDTSRVGDGIVRELDNQRSTILHAREGLGNVNMAITRSKRIVGSMMRRARTNRIMMWFIIAALVVMIALVVYYKWIK